MIEIQHLTSADIDAAMQLVEAAGWNQTLADWQRVIEYQPWGCFKAVLDDRFVGTVTSTSYGKQLAWIGMMLVDPSTRRQGVGRALMQRVIRVLQSTEVETIKLDATPMGRPLYEQLGFVAQFDFQRLRRPSTSEASLPAESQPWERLAEYRELDRQAFGVDRGEWLTKVAQSSHCTFEPGGLGMLRAGRIADYLGPIIASSPVTARGILTRLIGSTSREIFWDLPQSDASLHLWARTCGFEPVRVLTRMTLELDTTIPNLAHQFALCDPACG